MPSTPRLTFPKSFLWGVGTSAHQVEGGLHNQWTVWELENAKALAAQAPYHYDDLDNWEAIKRRAKHPGNYVSGRGVSHYERYEQDIELVRKLTMNAFRLSIEWSRVQPEQDAWDAAAIKHYKDVLAACKKRGIEPIVTLFHTTLPVWYAQMGGFERRANVGYFVAYATRLLAELGPLVKYVITLNDPDAYVREGYTDGHWPPQVTNWRVAMRVRHHLALAHNRIADSLHDANRRYKVSIAKNYHYIYPGDDAWLSVKAAQMKHYLENDAFLRKVVKRCDFIGLNYYSSDRVYGYRVHNPNHRVSDIGWDMHPHHVALALEQLYEKYNKPIMITENGLADEGDVHREWWLTQTIVGMQSARDKGVELIGYIYASLLDGFEWEKGYWPKYGLFSVDRKTMQRSPRRSALWLAKTVRRLRE